MKKLMLSLCVILTMVISSTAFATVESDDKTVVQIVLADANNWDPGAVMNPGFYVYAQAYERLIRYNRPGQKPELLPLCVRIVVGFTRYEIFKFEQGG